LEGEREIPRDKRTSYVKQYKELLKQNSKDYFTKVENTPKLKEEAKKKTIISLIDDSDEEGETVDVSDSKIAKATKAK
jgi:site-specific DNA-cytosine methylase